MVQDLEFQSIQAIENPGGGGQKKNVNWTSGDISQSGSQIAQAGAKPVMGFAPPEPHDDKRKRPDDAIGKTDGKNVVSIRSHGTIACTSISDGSTTVHLPFDVKLLSSLLDDAGTELRRHIDMLIMTDEMSHLSHEYFRRKRNRTSASHKDDSFLSPYRG